MCTSLILDVSNSSPCYINILSLHISFLKLFILKWEKSNQSKIDSPARQSQFAVKSIHNLFKNAKFKADEQKLKEYLFKQNYIDFRQIVESAEPSHTELSAHSTVLS